MKIHHFWEVFPLKRQFLSHRVPASSDLMVACFAEPPSSAGDAFLHRSKGLFVRVVDRLRRDGPTRPRAHHVQVSSTFMLIRFAHLTTNIVMLCRFLQTSIAFQYAPTVHNNVKNILMFFLRSLYINSPTFNLSLH